jgi:RNA polymerase sigma factor (sigma-70 family)
MLTDNELLIKQYQNGDKSALNNIIDKNKKIVYMVVNKYYTNTTNSIDKEDLVQEGFIGLIIAAKKYNPDYKRKAKFTTYAFYWINQRINRFITNRNTSLETSLDEPLAGTEDATMYDSLVGETDEMYLRKIETKEMQKEVAKMLDTLTFIEKNVIKCRYGFYGQEYTSQEIKKALNISTEDKVIQIQYRSLNKLKSTRYARMWKLENTIHIYSVRRRSVEESTLYKLEIDKLKNKM